MPRFGAFEYHRPMFAQPLIDRLTRLRAPREFPLSDFSRVRDAVAPCDVILVEGRSKISDVIKMITQSPWSHAALSVGSLVDQPDHVQQMLADLQLPAGEQLVIESVLGRGTIVVPLAKYAEDHLRICRPEGLTSSQADRVLGYATSRLGVPYDVRHIFDLLRFLLPWSMFPRRWRSTLFRRNVGDSTRTVCSVMIAEAFGRSDFPILPLIQKHPDQEMRLYRRNPRLCTPSDFDYSPYFQIIKYPFVDITDHARRGLLPWHGNPEVLEDD